MYTSYFGLEEKPFSIAPNPDFLFMSDRHREALNHLTYGLGDTGGFVLLTGEVGTGKTTISRRLMENLPDNTQAAFILNPTLSSHELLATVCDELKIRYRKTGATLKTLTDKIQQKLLKNHEAGLNTLLIIDEAQHLEPEVLEQLRLLTNLETNTKKLLQVILIGQPELQQLLKRRDLRQLAQRITARYHLLPLNKQEVAQYIKHRLSVAKCFRDLFDRSAVSALHKTCKGIPRLMNLVAERSLINAYNSNDAVVNRKIVLKSARDALGDEYQLIPWWRSKALKYSLAVVVTLTLAAGVGWGVNQWTQPVQLADGPKAKSAEPAITVQQSTAEPIERDGATVNTSDEIAAKTEVALANNIPAATAKPVVVEEPVAEVVLRAEPEAKITAPEPAAPVTEFSVKEADGVSDELLARFQSAIADTAETEEQREGEPFADTNADIKPLTQMPNWVQDGIPSLQFEMHIYASDGQGWVRVNGRDRYEGDYIGRELLLNEILPQQVVLSFRGEKFTMAALSSWN